VQSGKKRVKKFQYAQDETHTTEEVTGLYMKPKSIWQSRNTSNKNSGRNIKLKLIMTVEINYDGRN